MSKKSNESEPDPALVALEDDVARYEGDGGSPFLSRAERAALAAEHILSSQTAHVPSQQEGEPPLGPDTGFSQAA